MSALLALDPAKVSGWALYVNGAYHSSGCGTHNRADRDRIIAGADALGEMNLAIVMETWSLHGKWSNAAKMSVCEQAGRWKESMEYHAVVHRLVRVPVDQWRRGLFGRSNMKSEQAKAMAMLRARASTGRPAVDDNEAEAICIAVWALQHREVRVLLGDQEGRSSEQS